jgi:hypothetical protein
MDCRALPACCRQPRSSNGSGRVCGRSTRDRGGLVRPGRGCCRNSPTPPKLVAFARTLPGLVVSVLVPNLKGAERALETAAHLMLCRCRQSRAQPGQPARDARRGRAEIARIRAARDAAGSRCLIEVGLSTAFGCTLQGRVETGRSAAPRARGAGRRRRSRRPRRHRRLRRSADGRELFERASRSPATSFAAVISTTRAAWASPTSSPRGRRASAASMRASRHRRLSARARRQRQRRDRRRRVPVRQHGHSDRPGFREADCAAPQGRAVARRRGAVRIAVARGPAEDDAGGDGGGAR